MNDKKYNHTAIEQKWQERWEEEKLYESKIDETKPKYYHLNEFPYPSGDGLHVGHVESYTAADIVVRKKRMEGYNVMFPMGFDAFGLPAENFAIKNKIHPRKAIEKNVATFRKQIKSIGLSYDWSREVNTTDPEYYKWTQWIFLKLYKRGLAYMKEAPVNWCPSCKCGLANEEVVDGKCERCGAETGKKMLKQWYLAITKYADRLLEDLDDLDWPEQIKQSQRNWIGRKEGITIKYQVASSNAQVPDKKDYIEVFTTRPDTNFGATFIVVAPEHEFVNKILNKQIQIDDEKLKMTEEYVEKAKNKSELERMEEGRKKTGVFTGLYAINSLNRKKIPIWISDFVLMDFGTGAVVGVPGHDRRDFEFAKEMKIDIVRVVKGSDGDESKITKIEQVQEDEGVMINSDFLNGMNITDAIEAMKDHLEKNSWGKRTCSYHLRDWLFSRQRYWGEPIPIIHCEKCGDVPVPEENLPVLLPDVKNYEPTGTGESPLAAIKDWVNVKCPKCSGDAKRETNTMPQWAGSCWYFLRYIDSKNNEEIFDQKKLKYWMPVDCYFGGAEHTVLHLLYSRFWMKVLYDEGVIPFKEPYKRRIHHGMILGEGGVKMSKSKGNVVNPDNVVKEYGADSLRMYEMFMGPYEDYKPWSMDGIKGVRRFLDRAYKVGLMISKLAKTNEVKLNHTSKNIHVAIKKISEDIDSYKFNTAIAQLMIFFNGENNKPDWRSRIENIETNPCDLDAYKSFLILLSPFAPHIAEELWEKLGYKESIFKEKWPEFNPKLIVDERVKIAIQVNGKLRDVIEVEKGMDDNELKKLAKTKKVEKFLAGRDVKKIIAVKDRLMNFVV